MLGFFTGNKQVFFFTTIFDVRQILFKFCLNNISRFHCTVLHDNVRGLKDVEAPFLDPLATINSGLSYFPGKEVIFAVVLSHPSPSNLLFCCRRFCRRPALLHMLLEESVCARGRRDGESSAKYALDRALRKHHKPNL